jgi:hypothetical protein
MNTLLQVQEAGSSATQSLTNAASQASQSAQQNGSQSYQNHQFALNALNQLLQGFDQSAGAATAGASSLIGSTMGNL